MLKLKLDAHKTATKRRFRLRPRHEWVLIEKITPEERQTEAGVVVDMSQTKSYQARVLAKGEKVLDLLIGDLVLVSAFPMEIEDVQELLSGEQALTDASLRRDVFLIRDEEIYCVIEEDVENNGI
jgi:co-chaperonin GroES (HSP10)